MEENKEKNVVNEEQETLPKGMILCKTCGAKMAKKAKKCPSCGAKNKKPIYKRIWFWILAIIVIVLVVNAIKRAGLDVKKPTAKLTADEIIKEFYEGEEKGESKYKDTVVAVTGKVGNIEEDCFYIDTFAELSTFFSVCVKPADKSVLTSLKKDSVITVSGICDGKSLGSIDIEKAIIDSSFAVNPDYNSPMTVPITTLMQAYKDNEVSADAQYWGKTVEFTGEVRYIADTNGYIVVVPEGQGKSLDSVLDGIMVFFEEASDFEQLKNDANPDALGSPKKTVKVTIAGVCYGEAFGYDAQVCRAKVK